MPGINCWPLHQPDPPRSVPASPGMAHQKVCCGHGKEQECTLGTAKTGSSRFREQRRGVYGGGTNPLSTILTKSGGRQLVLTLGLPSAGEGRMEGGGGARAGRTPHSWIAQACSTAKHPGKAKRELSQGRRERERLEAGGRRPEAGAPPG